MNKTPYYTLLVREETNQGLIWTPQFGDKDKSVVIKEQSDIVYYDSVKKKDTYILGTHQENQVIIDTRIEIMNQQEADKKLFQDKIIRDRSVRQNLDITKDNFTKLIQLKVHLATLPLLWEDDTQPDALRLIDNAVEGLYDLIETTYNEYNSEGK